MIYKYDAGDSVTVKDPRSLETQFTVVQRMPGEYNASEPRYKIKSEAEGFERVVAESAVCTENLTWGFPSQGAKNH